MSTTDRIPGQRMFLPKVALDAMIDILDGQGYSVIAPTLHRDVIRLKPVSGSHEIARGIRDLQDGGSYRLEQGDEELFFEYAVGPDSAKPFFFPVPPGTVQPGYGRWPIIVTPEPDTGSQTRPGRPEAL